MRKHVRPEFYRGQKTEALSGTGWGGSQPPPPPGGQHCLDASCAQKGHRWRSASRSEPRRGVLAIITSKCAQYASVHVHVRCTRAHAVMCSEACGFEGIISGARKRIVQNDIFQKTRANFRGRLVEEERLKYGTSVTRCVSMSRMNGSTFTIKPLLCAECFDESCRTEDCK